MFHIVLIAFVLVAVTVVVHAAGLTLMLMGLRRWHALPPTHFWPISRLLLGMMWYLMFLHVAEISIWGLFYRAWGCLADAEAAFYFSGVTYTTLGYGDVLLTKPWRLLAPIEGVTGILMCGLSTSVFFSVVLRVDHARRRFVDVGASDDLRISD